MYPFPCYTFNTTAEEADKSLLLHSSKNKNLASAEMVSNNFFLLNNLILYPKNGKTILAMSSNYFQICGYKEINVKTTKRGHFFAKGRCTDLHAVTQC